jgi:hypothetical protein
MLTTSHEPGLTASNARDTSLTAQYGSKHRQSSNSCASVALPHFPSARRAAHASPTCGHERRAFAAVQRRVSDTRESDMCADCAFHERATPPARQIPAASDLDVEVDSRPSPQRKRTDTKGSAAESSVPTRSVGGAAREQRHNKNLRGSLFGANRRGAGRLRPVIKRRSRADVNLGGKPRLIQEGARPQHDPTSRSTSYVDARCTDSRAGARPQRPRGTRA